MIKGTHRVRNGVAGARALREAKFWWFAGDVGPQEAARLTAPLTCVLLAKTSLLAIIVLLASCCSPSRFPLAIVVIITIAIGHHRHRIAIAIVPTMLLSYQSHYDSLILAYYCTIVLSYEVMPRACLRHA